MVAIKKKKKKIIGPGMSLYYYTVFQNSSSATPVNPRAERRAEIVWMVELPDPPPPGALVAGFAFGQTAIIIIIMTLSWLLLVIDMDDNYCTGIMNLNYYNIIGCPY